MYMCVINRIGLVFFFLVVSIDIVETQGNILD